MKLNLKPYVSSLTASKESKEAGLAPSRAAEASAALGLEIAQLDTQLLKAQNGLTELTQAFPLNSGSIVQALDTIGLLERKLSQLNELRTQLFPA